MDYLCPKLAVCTHIFCFSSFER